MSSELPPEEHELRGTNRVIRGSCHYSSVRFCWSANRGCYVAEHRYSDTGLRIVIAVEDMKHEQQSVNQ